MNKITDYIYQVAQNETVTIVFTPVQVGESFVAVALDGQTLNSPPGPNPTYTFEATKPPGKVHFGKIECSFPDGTPDTARFESRVKGSLGGDFSGPTVNKTDAVHDPDVEFRVV